MLFRQAINSVVRFDSRKHDRLNDPSVAPIIFTLIIVNDEEFVQLPPYLTGYMNAILP